MLTLIWRELVDHAAHLVLAAAISAITVGLLLLPLVAEAPQDMVGLVAWLIVFALFGFCFLGAGQMYADRANRISSFLSTQAVTRGQILLARFVVGLLAILIVLVPVGITVVVDLQRFLSPFGFYWPFTATVCLVTFLTALACYGMGLQIGWYVRKTPLIFGALLLPATVISLVAIKGFAADTIGLLLLLVVTLIVAVALKFRSTPL
jgi:ABC-type transport system involved in multi-copper enzyme maturation permease subunit